MLLRFVHKLFSVVSWSSWPLCLLGGGSACLWSGLSFQGYVQREQSGKIDLISPNRANKSFK